MIQKALETKNEAGVISEKKKVETREDTLVKNKNTGKNPNKKLKNE